MVVYRPSVPQQARREDNSCEISVLTHAVFRVVDGFSFGVEAAGGSGFARHDGVHPAAAKEGGDDVAEGGGNVEQAYYRYLESVGGCGEGFLDGDVEDVEGAEGNAGKVDGKEDSGKT